MKNMMSDKIKENFFLITFFSLIIGLGLGYFIFTERGVGPKQIEDYQLSDYDYERPALPPFLMEGIVSDINIDKQVIKISIMGPQEIEGEVVHVNFDSEETRFQQNLLEVYGPDDVVSIGTEELDYSLIEVNDQILVNIGLSAVKSVKEGKELNAGEITLITETIRN